MVETIDARRTVTVRQAGPDDIGQLSALCRAFSSLSPYGDVRDTNTTEHIERHLRAVMENGFVAVAHDGADIVGLMAVLLTDHPVTGGYTAFEVAFYVTPEARGGPAAGELMSFAEYRAGADGAVRLQLGAPNKAVARFFERRGFKSVETTYVKELR